MSGTLIGMFDLLDRRTGKFVEAQVVSPAGSSNVADIDASWRPLMQARIEHLRAQNRLNNESIGENELQDAHWRWSEKVEMSSNRLDRQSFAIVAEGATQGLMLVTTAGFAREPTQHGKPLVTIDLLATAPWNRRRFDPAPRFKGVGRIMMVAAISLSVQEEFSGRVGLHALPQADAWYRDTVGMTDLGIDETRMRYFELTEAQARAFLA
ncbi:GNAT family N-acetyltransferase [Rhizobium sp. WYJ-E13]|uniref:GNAT family N-acetyltransferase n=1 Tax=unclassified Rhizobium TaxID=2613769 RepID=UPI001C1EC016|nr:GNAT family N-acetyltransferase [Rhizobium sp. WYJ-E13]QWW71169.1 GNAT family N-acetyltransferase [Rhizobium sp. WYJ-E13]